MHSTIDSTPDVSALSLAVTHVQTVPFDCTNGYGDTWDYLQADTCSACGAPLLTDGGEAQHGELDESSTCEGYVSGDGPMFNYLYPLASTPSDDEVREALADLPLCVVVIRSDDLEDQAFLGLTGGGMNMAWEICTAYVRIGYAPPIAYCDLPGFASMRLTDETRFVIAACERSVRVVQRDAERTAAHLRDLRAQLNVRPNVRP